MKRYISASKWNNDWRYDIPGDVRSRLADCNNTWNDIKQRIVPREFSTGYLIGIISLISSIPPMHNTKNS